MLSVCCYGQFAVVSDKDGYVNIRAGASTKERVIDTLSNGHVIFCYDFDEVGSWKSIAYVKAGLEESNEGTIYKDRYVFVSSFKKIPVVVKGTSTVKWKKDSIEVAIVSRPFDESKHTYKRNKNFIELIDNKKAWGTDGGIPREEYVSIIVKMGSKTFALPRTTFSDLYEPGFEFTEVNFDKTSNTLYIQANNGDGAGGYSVIWRIVNGFYKDRFVLIGI
ncbi:hypothetical protein FLA_1979 [Filimonas lacunae]|nr:hypothetical protein FLA_1979 [Filimonas lacunae]